MIQTQTLQAVCQALQNQEAVDFVRTSIKAGYFEFFSKSEEVAAMVDNSFARLAKSQHHSIDPLELLLVTSALLEHTFRKQDSDFWFNRLYHQYKTEIKPETDFQQLKELIKGESVLDYGCGSGYLAARLAKGGFRVFTTDVLDYRYEEAKDLPFVRMASPADLAFPDDSIDTAVVQAVLHHIDEEDLSLVIQRLRRVAKYVLIKEDTYDLPDDLQGLADRKANQPLLRAFVGLPREAQFQTLLLIDFFANAIAQGIPEMNMPFRFKTVTEWQQVLQSNGLKVSKTLVAGFEPGRIHKSCHVWFVCERIK